MRYKLNMLEPAIKIFRVIFILLIVSAILYLFKYRILAIIFSSIAVFLIILILIGVAIELRQDRYLVKQHFQKRNEAKYLENSYECEYCGARFKMKSSYCPICGKSLKT